LLGALRAVLDALGEWTAPALHGAVQAFAEARQLGLGKVAQPLRVALTGGTVSPPIDATLALLGREKVLARVGAALK
jgi:glutamyl-tRNA synthetase